jgi:hypothetical protein
LIFFSEKNIPLWLAKSLSYEYWPVWVMYFPAIIYGIWLSIRAKSITYYTATNPGIELGGLFGESKIQILKMIPETYLPKTLYFIKNTPLTVIVTQLNDKSITFPIICKPDKGERGYRVEKIENLGELANYLETNYSDFIIQEFVEFSVELGILYYRKPSSPSGEISSIVKKEFLSVKGDGFSTIRDLLQYKIRSRIQLPVLEIRWNTKLNQVLKKDEIWLAEPIGNHSRGTCFLNGNSLINKQLVEVFDTITENMEGFHFGRFDLKVRSINDLYEGKNIKIMELNGISSEPAHIYDPNFTVFKAWKAILDNMKTIYEISIANNKRGVKYIPAFEVLSKVRMHFKNLKTERSNSLV